MAAAGFGLFKAGQRVGCLRDFTVAENVIVQTTAVATATMPLAAGFVGVVPALRWGACGSCLHLHDLNAMACPFSTSVPNVTAM